MQPGVQNSGGLKVIEKPSVGRSHAPQAAQLFRTEARLPGQSDPALIMCNCFSGRRVRLALLERQTRTECQLVLLAPAIHQGTQERMGFIGAFRPTHGQRVLAQRMDGHPVFRIGIGTCRGQGHQG
ncbi:MAG: hypothetical protein KDB87_09730, partial [Flavobacteriales bacterium]|nr:hypothetical protein [Flavobacteriales bacterium]